ncbi:MAG: hypothetical protein NTX29_15205 [Actinobacteria bacterium]|jgi:hypothetical protein|nr:hypothetical protein [Actinomycetota bacterium]
MRKVDGTWYFADGSTLSEAQADLLADYLESDDALLEFRPVEPTVARPAHDGITSARD